MTAMPTLETKLLALRERFLSLLPARIEELSHLLHHAELRPLRTRFHNLAGTAGTYGLATVSALGAEGENVCAKAERVDEPTRARLRSLIDAMRRASRGCKAPSQRILYVEGAADQSEVIVTILREAGYDVEIVGNAKQFAETYVELRPDLILVDAFPRNGSGVELARSIRDNPAYATLPVVFLVEAMEIGADDDVTKPVQPDLLLSILAARMNRSRSIQALIDHDALTGALTRGCFFRRAETAAAAARHGQPLALAMLDLDHFKSVNDRYGHLVGDRVLMAFTTFLKLNLRPGDEVGRYGGEEFLLLLRDLHALDTQKLVTRLIDRFARIPHTALDGTTFQVSFSAGVAMWDPDCDAQTWRQRADEALYSAKHHGRARVEAA